jgi:hypothetical protein
MPDPDELTPEEDRKDKRYRALLAGMDADEFYSECCRVILASLRPEKFDPAAGRQVDACFDEDLAGRLPTGIYKRAHEECVRRF